MPNCFAVTTRADRAIPRIRRQCSSTPISTKRIIARGRNAATKRRRRVRFRFFLRGDALGLGFPFRACLVRSTASSTPADAGTRVVTADVSEFHKKGGGSVKCMIGDLGELPLGSDPQLA